MNETARPIRVAVVVDAVGPWSKGGREVRYMELLPRLVDAGFSLEVFTMKWWREPPSGAIKFTAICGLIPMYKGSRRSIWQAFVFAAATLRLLASDFDVILADHMPYLQLFPLRFVAWVKRVELLVQWHEVWGRDYWSSYLGRAGVIASGVEHAAMRLPNGIVGGSEAVAERLVESGVPRGRVVVVPNGVDRERLESVVRHRDWSTDLLVVGRLIPHKRPSDALMTLARLRDAGRMVRLTFIGDGPERSHLEQLAVELGIASSVTFLGSVERLEDVWSRMREARVLVFPSEREGFGLAVAECLALGTPVVVVDHPDNDAKALVNNGVTGSICRRDDVDSLADGVATWLDSKVGRDQIAQRFWIEHPTMDWASGCSTLSAALKTAAATRR